MEKPKRKVGRPLGSVETKLSAIKIKNKKLLLKALRENLGILAPALKVACMNRETFSKYYEVDLEFRKEVDDIREEAIDYVEGQLLKQINTGGAAQTIFFLKTKGKSRGYIETTETNMTIDAIKIKYIVPKDEPNDPTSLPLNNNIIKISIPNDENK